MVQFDVAGGCVLARCESEKVGDEVSNGCLARVGVDVVRDEGHASDCMNSRLNEVGIEFRLPVGGTVICKLNSLAKNSLECSIRRVGAGEMLGKTW